MIAPEDVAREAKKFEDENYRFRLWLKNSAEPDELDARFREPLINSAARLSAPFSLCELANSLTYLQ